MSARSYTVTIDNLLLIKFEEAIALKNQMDSLTDEQLDQWIALLPKQDDLYRFITRWLIFDLEDQKKKEIIK